MKNKGTLLTALLLAGIVLAGQMRAAMAQAPDSNEASTANVTVLAIPGDTFQSGDPSNPNQPDPNAGYDELSITYRRAIPESQAKRDALALASVLQTHLFQLVYADSSQPTKPTTMTVSVSNLFPPGARHFNIEPLIIALKSYKKIRLAFAPRPGMTFDGLENYSNPYVHISFNQSPPATKDLQIVNAPFMYFITIDDPNFTSLNLPLTSQDVATVADTDAGRMARLKIVLGIALILVLASLVGWVVYRKLNGVRNLYNKSLAVSNTRTTNKGLKNGR